jgi:putative ABC transport system permease protein
MSLTTLAFTLVFVLVALVISLWQRLGIERDIVIATVRASIQLLAVGYILKFVFSSQSPIYTILMVTIMALVAAQNAYKRAKTRQGAFWRVLFAIALTEVVTQGFLLGVHIVPAKVQYIIPISGMIIGNSMVAASLLLNRLQGEVKSRKQEVLVVLSLGGTPKQAILPILKEAIRASMIPTVDSTKTTGLVQLPGMMTGQIIAGADPIQAVRYQLLILFSIMASAAITCFTLGFLVYPSFFNKQMQLIGIPDTDKS